MAQLEKTTVYQIRRRMRGGEWMELAVSAGHTEAKMIASALRIADIAAGYRAEIEIREREASWLSTPN